MKLPKNYHTDYREDTKKYYFYYLGRKEGKKDYSSRKYFDKHSDAEEAAIKHFKSKK